MHHSLSFLDQNDATALEQLCTFLSMPSISTAPENASDVKNCGLWLKDHLEGIGMPVVEFHETSGHPIVYAEHLGAGADKPTVLMYGHYDVQPVDPLELWTNPPFEPTIVDGKVFARGATDDKGQVFLHVKAVEALLQDGNPPVNIKLLIEGEEEVGSPNLSPFVKTNKDRLACDAVVVSDTSMFAPGEPSIVYGLRGLSYVEVEVKGPNRDLHSGSYGGPVLNPLNVLADIISSMKDATGAVTIDGFYDAVEDLDDKERAELNGLGFADNRMKEDVQAEPTGGEQGYTVVEKLWTRPTLDVNGILGGYTGEGAKTVLPAKAMAKISMRLVPHQKNKDITAAIQRHVEKVCPVGVTATVTDLHGADPVLVDRGGRAMSAAERALEETYGVKCIYQREGVSIPVVELFDSVLGVPTVLMGFGLSTENLHSPNEHFHLDNFRKGMRAAVRFYTYMATV